MAEIRNTDNTFMNLTLQTITVPAPLSIDTEAMAIQSRLIQSSSKCVQVTDAREQAIAAIAARDIRTYVKQIGEARLAVTRPVDAYKETIMEFESTLLDPLKTEQARIERLQTDFAIKEKRRVAAEEEARRMAIEKAEQERIEAEDKARKAAEKMQTEAGLNRALEAEHKAVEAEAKVQEIIRAPLPEVQKAAGIATKQVLRHEVLDIRAVYAARPELCKLEISPAAVKATCVPEMPVPGLRLWWETVSNTRAWR